MTSKDRSFNFLASLDPDLREFVLTSLRCHWTHSSTALEGNTFTLGDTQFFLKEGLTVSGRTLQEHLEISGHAEGMELLYDLAENGKPLDEGDLFALHSLVCKKDFIDALKPVGAWKRETNGTEFVEDGKVVWHEYAHPLDVPGLMAEWLHRFNAITACPQEKAAEIYASLHLAFVSIHPFWDGNGRMARLVANIPLLRAGLPPIMINKEKRRQYLETLRLFQKTGKFFPDVEEARPLADFVQGEWSTSLGIIAEARKRQQSRHRH